MSITRKEAIKILQHLAEIISNGDYQEAFMMSVSALRPVSLEKADDDDPVSQRLVNMAKNVVRSHTLERIEKVWRGQWVKCKHADYYVCNKCSTVSKTGEDEFCKSCGAPMTDEAVEMVMERLEALKDGKDI